MNIKKILAFVTIVSALTIAASFSAMAEEDEVKGPGVTETATASDAMESEVPAANLVSMGMFKTTAYCPCNICSEGWGRKTSTGAIATANHTIAVDPRVIPYGSTVMIDGICYTAEDRGGGVKGNHIDIFFDSHAETHVYGKRNVEVFMVTQ